MPLHNVPRLSPRALAHAVLLAVLAVSALLPSRAWDASLMQAAAQRLGPRALSEMPSLQALLNSARSQSDPERLQAVNQFFNQRISFRSDTEVWGFEDYWASPLQLLAKGQGDCEDYAIAKYASLVAGGVPPQRLRLVYVRARVALAGAAQAHMVLAYYEQVAAEPLILDNLKPDIQLASRRSDLSPVFSFNAEGLWQSSEPGSVGDPLARLSRWREVLQKTKEEGF
jgi:predicted transglutaminase-like cysteine proteinase